MLWHIFSVKGQEQRVKHRYWTKTWWDQKNDSVNPTIQCVEVDSYIAEVFHSHPGNGHVKVGRLTPVALYILIVILPVLQLWGEINRIKVSTVFYTGMIMIQSTYCAWIDEACIYISELSASVRQNTLGSGRDACDVLLLLGSAWHCKPRAAVSNNTMEQVASYPLSVSQR